MKHTKLLSTVALTALVAVCSGQTTNYCTAGLCSAGKTHIACNGLTTLSSTCGAGASEATLDSTKKNLIVNVHNQLRNTVALGKQANGAGQYFNQAAKMATLQWDQELADIAAVNARSCVFGHDKCRNTATMKYVGQNIAMSSYSGMSFTDEQLITGFVNNWFKENKDATALQMASYPANYKGPTIGHFTQVVSDRSSKVGCSLVSYIEDGFVNQLFVCNYGLTNIVKQPVYVAGTACSKCTTGCNTAYPGLCSAAEPITNNP
ncbi:antigen 5 like allergen Cul n 1-like [Ochlerotatus camptorhynchus]|uniref:antigen 5 like allergen Cul n 1-like n=1 Tax=Ochlerotatus camptorhynchus TaxID=644619 RepID=UPI0031E14D8A